ncbi:ThuA domain-containing protein [Tamlana crocina]
MKTILFLLLSVMVLSCKAPESVLVFSKTEGFRHKSIETGVEVIRQLGKENKFKVTHTEDSNVFSNEGLKDFDAIVFLSTTGNVFSAAQEQAFKTYINNGGSFMGVHSATNTEYNWPWYGKLVGAYFLDHPKHCEAHVHVEDAAHQSTKHLKSPWVLYDEWYNYRDMSPDLKVLLTVDESSYVGGKHGDYHPIAWYGEYDGGRMFYTGLGHTIEIYSNPEFKQHVLGGIFYCLKR